jgi:hypothetical protein
MIRRIRHFLPWFGAVAALLLLGLPAQADGIESESNVEEEAGSETAAESDDITANAILDLVLIRPLYLARFVVGVPFFIFYPLTLESGFNEDAVALLWTEPFEATFLRPLGESPNDY